MKHRREKQIQARILGEQMQRIQGYARRYANVETGPCTESYGSWDTMRVKMFTECLPG